MIKLSVDSIICINKVSECFCWSCIHKLILDFFFFLDVFFNCRKILAITHLCNEYNTELYQNG